MTGTPDKKLDDANVHRRALSRGDLDHIGETAEWLAWFDGAALPNPGRIGLGVVLWSPTQERVEWSAVSSPSGCNNEAELRALIAALELAMKAGARRIRASGDSDFAVRIGLACLSRQQGQVGVTTKVPRFLPLIARLDELLQCFEAVVLIWIPRHRNRDADRLSRRVLGLPDKPWVQGGR